MKNLMLFFVLFFLVISCSKETDSETPTPTPTVKYTLTITAGSGGSVDITGGEYEKGTSVTVTADPNAGYEFEKWSDDNTDNPRTIVVNSNTSLEAQFKEQPTYFVSKAPSSYSDLNRNSGELINQYFFPGFYLTDDYFEENIKIEGHRGFGSDGIFFDYDGDNLLDYFGFFTNFDPNWGVNTGKLVLVRDILNEKEIISFDTEIKLVTKFELNDFNNDGSYEILMAAQNGHSNGNGNFGNEISPKIYSLDPLANLTVYDFQEDMGIHDMSSGDVDNDGDIDILFWRYNTAQAPNVDTNEPLSIPILYLNDGAGTFTRKDPYETFNGLLEIVNTSNQYVVLGMELFDVNGDGFLDIVSGSTLNNTVYNGTFAPDYSRIYWGDGSGNFDLENFTDLVDTSISGKNFQYPSVLGFGFFDIDNNGLMDIFSTVTPDYAGFVVQCFLQKEDRVFEEATSSIFDEYSLVHTSGNAVDGDFPNFYNIRFYDIDNDGDFDLIPDGVGSWGGHDYSDNLHWKNEGGILRLNK